MLDSIREAVSFVSQRTRTDLDRDRMLTLSLVKCIEIIGEAASKVGAETRRLQPSVPWDEIVAMRNRLIHAYFDIDLDRVWDTVTGDLPPLQAELERIVSAATTPPSG
jgi:uncharacterized protein with HEPN domain